MSDVSGRAFGFFPFFLPWFSLVLVADMQSEKKFEIAKFAHRFFARQV
jgi:hypothetical protein